VKFPIGGDQAVRLEARDPFRAASDAREPQDHGSAPVDLVRLQSRQ
jgi:hypothetical protein